MCLGESVMVRFGITAPPADLNVLGPGYEVQPDLATIPYAPLHMRFMPPELAMSDRTFEMTLLAP